MARRTYNTIKLIAVCLAIYCSAFALSARDYSLILSGGYTGSTGNYTVHQGYNEVNIDKTNGAIVELAFQMPVYNRFYFSPAAAFDMRYVQNSKWLGEFSLRTVGGYSLPMSNVALNIFTGPRMDVKAFEYLSEIYDASLPPGTDFTYDPRYNRVNAYWMFGLCFEYHDIVLKGSYSLPLTRYVKPFKYPSDEYHKRLHIFEVTLGYRFRIGK
ncbi:MAG: hypothetical protein OSJ37_07175 [Muribaculaceae bacterium]|jgi:hypothetical protein|nr:hypothetical protein [Muribaculaceae bacterium]